MSKHLLPTSEQQYQAEDTGSRINQQYSSSLGLYKHPMGCEAQLAWKCLYTPTFWRAILTRDVSQTDLDFSVRSGFISIGLRMQDCKFLCASVTICSTLVNIQTDGHIQRQHFDMQLIWKAQPAELKMVNRFRLLCSTQLFHVNCNS